MGMNRQDKGRYKQSSDWLKGYLVWIGVILLSSSCTLWKPDLVNSRYAANPNQGSSSNSFLYLDSNAMFYYQYHHHGFEFFSSGYYVIQRNRLILTSVLADSIIPFEVQEMVDSSLAGFEITLDSSVAENLDFVQLIINDSFSFSDGNYVIGNTPKFIGSYELSKFRIQFIHGFKTNNYTVQNPSANRFHLFFKFPGVLDSFRIINHEKLIIKQKYLLWNGVKLYRVI